VFRDQIPSSCNRRCQTPPRITPRRHLATPVAEGGFPHSEIPGSKPVRSSPGLIAAYHVLHRLSAPRHPPDALLSLHSLSWPTFPSKSTSVDLRVVRATPEPTDAPAIGLARLQRRRQGRHGFRHTDPSVTIHPSPANTRHGGTTVQRPFKSHETCPSDHGAVKRREANALSNPFRDALASTRPDPCGSDHRTCLLFTMTVNERAGSPRAPRPQSRSFHPDVVAVRLDTKRIGGARRDRTDDLMLAKHALSQLSYGPDRKQR
jgi:hypothetical protein